MLVIAPAHDGADSTSYTTFLGGGSISRCGLASLRMLDVQLVRPEFRSEAQHDGEA